MTGAPRCNAVGTLHAAPGRANRGHQASTFRARRSTYPCECEYRACTRDGIEYVIRPIVPDDLERELAFVQSLSAESLYKRLMYAVRPTRDMLGPYVSVDYDHRMALVALDGASGQEHIIGVARYACDDDIAARIRHGDRR